MYSKENFISDLYHSNIDRIFYHFCLEKNKRTDIPFHIISVVFKDAKDTIINYFLRKNNIVALFDVNNQHIGFY